MEPVDEDGVVSEFERVFVGVASGLAGSQADLTDSGFGRADWFDQDAVELRQSRSDCVGLIRIRYDGTAGSSIEYDRRALCAQGGANQGSECIEGEWSAIGQPREYVCQPSELFDRRNRSHDRCLGPRLLALARGNAK